VPGTAFNVLASGKAMVMFFEEIFGRA